MKKIKSFINKKRLICYSLILISTISGILSHYFLSPYSQNIEKDLCCSLYENKTDDIILISAETEEKMPEDFYEKYCLKDNRSVFETAKYSKNINCNGHSFPLISTDNKGSIYYTYNHMSALTSRGFNGFKNFNDSNAIYLTEELAKNIFSISTVYVDSSILDKEIIIQINNRTIPLIVKGIIRTDEESSASSSGYLFRKHFGNFGLVSNKTIEMFEQAGILESFYTKSFPKVSTFASTYDKFNNLLKSKKLKPQYANVFIENTIKTLTSKKNSLKYMVPGVILTVLSLATFGYAIILLPKLKCFELANGILVSIATLIPYILFLNIKIKINNLYTTGIYTNGSVLFGSLLSVIFIFLAFKDFIFFKKNELKNIKLLEIQI